MSRIVEVDIPKEDVDALYAFFKTLAFDPRFVKVRELPDFTRVSGIVNRLVTSAV